MRPHVCGSVVCIVNHVQQVFLENMFIFCTIENASLNFKMKNIHFRPHLRHVSLSKRLEVTDILTNGQPKGENHRIPGR